MKSSLKKIGDGIIVLLILPIFIILGILCMLYEHINFIKYKRQRYYKYTHKKYERYGSINDEFKLYNFIKDNNLPIVHKKNKSKELEHVGYFIYKRTLIVTDVMPYYDEKKEKWMVITDEEKENDFTLKDYLDIRIKEFNEQEEYEVCDKAVVFLDESEYKEYVYKRESDNMIIFYNENNMKERLVERLNIVNI